MSEQEIDFDVCNADAERMMRIGCWDEATAAYLRCYGKGGMEASEKNLRMVTLKWRKECAEYARSIVADNGGCISAEALCSALNSCFDQYAANWVMHEYREIVRTKRGYENHNDGGM